MITFNATVKKFENTNLWSHYISIEEKIAVQFIRGKNRRVLCSINGASPFQCAIMHWTDGMYFINLNKEVRAKHALLEGEYLKVELAKDDSEFGLPFPESFKEVLDSDLEAKSLFDQLKPGRKRNLLYIAGKPKSVDKQIEKSLVIAEHLKIHNGKIDFKQLNEDFKNWVK